MMGVTSTGTGGAEEEENERRLRSVAEARSWFPQRRGQRPESGRRSPDAQTGGYHWVTGTQSTGGTGERTLQGGLPAERRRAVPPAPSIAG